MGATLRKPIGRREGLILLVFIIALLGLLYYHFVYKWFQSSKQAFDTTEIENQIMIEQTKAARIQAMRSEIESGKESDTGVVESYNNLKAEINQLNDIFKNAVDFDFGFDQATAEGDAVRRNINATFTAYSYDEAKEMLINLHNCQYRCLIKDISVSSVSIGNRRTGDPNLNRDPVSVRFTVTFYETMFGADTTDGLAIVSSDNSDTGENLLNQLAASKSEVENLGY